MGVVLLVADRDRRARRGALREVSVRDALLIGLAQAAAIVPGVSRSGATISMALFLGYRREEAARFSFLLATPITLRGGPRKVPQLLAAGGGDAAARDRDGGRGGLRLPEHPAAAAYVRTRDYPPFVYYRLAFAALVRRFLGACVVR